MGGGSHPTLKLCTVVFSMLTHHRKTVCLSVMSFDLPLWSVVETEGTLYQKDRDRFHLLLTEPLIQGFQCNLPQEHPAYAPPTLSQVLLPPTPRLLWLEFSPYRAILTMQGNGKFSYRHLWERGVYGISRYWLQNEASTQNEQFRLRNFTLDLRLTGHPLPQSLRVEYELWSTSLQLGRYVLNLEIHH